MKCIETKQIYRQFFRNKTESSKLQENYQAKRLIDFILFKYIYDELNI